MHRLPQLVELLLTEPPLSNRSVATRVGFSRRTVDRYARLVRGAEGDELRALSAPELDGLLNRRARKCVKRPPHIPAVLPTGETVVTRWRSYRFEDPRTAVGYSRFATLYRQQNAVTRRCRRKRSTEGGASC